MTRVELRDEIVRLSEPDSAQQRKNRGWLGVARDLVASVVESGLNLRETAALIRGEQREGSEAYGPPPVATVTLAEIYAAQGHVDRALATVNEVLEGEPEHASALALREKLLRERESGGKRRSPQVSEPSFVRQGERRDEKVAAPFERPAAPEVPAPEASSEKTAEPSEDSEFDDAEPVSMVVLEPPPVPKPALHPPANEASSRQQGFVRRRPACVLVQGDGRATVFWEANAIELPLVLRVVAVVPGNPLPVTSMRDIALGSNQGSIPIEALPANAVLRAALGRPGHEGSAESFKPIAVASVLRGGRGGAPVYRAPGYAAPWLEERAVS
jgi:hypothetical protein